MSDEPLPSPPPTLPYGSWPSAIRIDDVLAESIRVGDPWVDGDDITWLEGRPAEGGRTVLVRRGADGTDRRSDAAAVRRPQPRPRIRRRRVRRRRRDGRLLDIAATVACTVSTPGSTSRSRSRRKVRGGTPTCGSTRVRRRFLAVREEHAGDGQPVAAIVAVPLDGDRPPTVVVSGPDFLAAPRPSPDGTRLAWLEWDHPDMPWDATRLRVATVLEDGTIDRSDLAAGGPEESVAQPEWAPDGTLHLVSDRSGWWNLYRLVDGPRLEPLAPMEAEFADPAWLFDRSSYAFLPDGSIVAAARRDGHDHLIHIEPGVLVGEVATPFTEFGGLRVGGSTVVAVAGSPTDVPFLVAFDPVTLEPTGVLQRPSTTTIDPAWIARPESIAFPSTGDRTAYALFYPPTNPDVTAARR